MKMPKGRRETDSEYNERIVDDMFRHQWNGRGNTGVEFTDRKRVIELPAEEDWPTYKYGSD